MFCLASLCQFHIIEMSFLSVVRFVVVFYFFFWGWAFPPSFFFFFFKCFFHLLFPSCLPLTTPKQRNMLQFLFFFSPFKSWDLLLLFLPVWLIYKYTLWLKCCVLSASNISAPSPTNLPIYGDFWFFFDLFLPPFPLLCFKNLFFFFSNWYQGCIFLRVLCSEFRM